MTESDEPKFLEPMTIELSSVTVFWIKDLGMPKAVYDLVRFNARIGNKVANEVEEWLRGNAKSTWRIHEDGVWFIDKKDAALFKLFWSGKWDGWKLK